ncbi:ImmA/IrrE family metallo-endopeptidase [Bizionia saleffrena]|uniref:ImmA/IrrE family metallo-endopeptidase n=2 Tax=Bizionia saleffrena TaxID=291189 RepID=A0A8H2QIZ4_9FLAO|nr:ImmA/IrrE family metallo-endopeptidase [Bizionia saleffrena]
MRKIIILFILLISTYSYSQSVCKLTSQEIDLYLCMNDYTSVESSAYLTLGLSDIVSEIGLSQSNFTIKTCNSINNAVAVIIDGERELLIDEHYLSKLNNSTNKSFYLFILAHEIGHHLNGHTLKYSDNTTSRKQELEADYFAGFVLKKLNSPIQDITSTLNDIPHPSKNTGTHPILKNRILSANKGFEDAVLKEQKILQRFESSITAKVYESNRINSLNLARSFYSKFVVTGNMDYFNSSRRYYEELINKKQFRNAPYIELSYLYKLNEEVKESIQILNEIEERNNYTVLLLWENYHSLKKTVPKEIISAIETIENTDLEGLIFKTILAKYYLDTYKPELAENIFNALYDGIQESEENDKNKFELIHFYSNYAYFLNSKSEFETSAKNSKTAIDLINSTELKENKQVNTILKACYFTYSMALLGSKEYSLLEETLALWEDLELKQNIVNSNILYITARLQEETGKTKKAIKNFQSYLKTNKDPYANFHLGKCYLEIKNNKSACLEFKTSCENGVELACRYLKIKCDD